jgi:hypothetical protein
MIAGDGWIQYHAATLDIEIFAKETEGYRVNLQSTKPAIYVVLRRNVDSGSVHEVEVFHVTVCPFEASQYTDMGDDIVEGVPMPPEIAAWLADFIDKHHVDVPFVKRKRVPYFPGKGSQRRDDTPGGRNG